MIFEFTLNAGFNFLTEFSQQFNIPCEADNLTIPNQMGIGSIRKIDFSDGFSLLLHRYTFYEEFLLRRRPPEMLDDLITIVFYSSGLPNNHLTNPERSFACTKINVSSVEISSNDLSSEVLFPANREIIFTVINIKASVLAELMDVVEPNCLIERITSGKSTLLYHISMTPELEKTLQKIADTRLTDPLNKFFYKVKVQELFYLLFAKLMERQNIAQSPINSLDVNSLMLVRETVLADLSEPPNLKTLAKFANMSETKLKLLFRQVFGDSIYNYYQTARMDHAAYLIKQAGMTVSEVGHQLGFSNLSHFSRLFAKHHGRTPKKYQFVG
jgi:AraC-like DNA-binding protein